MAQRCGGNGLMVAGVIVTLIGLGIVLTRTLAIPREWTMVLIGVALLVAGAARRALRSGTGS
jgi:glucose uptake protein GlcU